MSSRSAQVISLHVYPGCFHMFSAGLKKYSEDMCIWATVIAGCSTLVEGWPGRGGGGRLGWSPLKKQVRNALSSALLVEANGHVAKGCICGVSIQHSTIHKRKYKYCCLTRYMTPCSHDNALLHRTTPPYAVDDRSSPPPCSPS